MLFLGSGIGYADCLCGQGDNNMDKVVDFYAKALKDKQIRIALCEARFDESSPEDFESFEEYIKNYEEEYCKLTTGDSLLESNFTEHSSDWQSLYVIEAIKGAFDRIVVYHEFSAVLGRPYPAFDAPNFAPLYESKWIVAFEYNPKGEKVIFEESNRTLPVLELASKEFGIIRYDAPNHLGIDAKEFVSDLKLLVKCTEEKGTKISSNELRTELGRKIFAFLKQEKPTHQPSTPEDKDITQAKEETTKEPKPEEQPPKETNHSTLHLKDGRTITGIITKEDPNTIKINTGVIEYTISKDEIDRIE